MKLGIYYDGSLDPKLGGGTVFQHSVIDAIARSGRRHDVAIFVPTMPSAIPEAWKDVAFHHVRDLRPGYRKRLWRVAERTVRAGMSVFFDRKLAAYGPLNHAVRQQRIDLLWFMSLRIETLSIPYAATVWDLAHRNLPCFPEVNVTGWTWTARERQYRETLPRASIIVTGTEAGKAEIVKYYQVPERTVQVIPFPTPAFALCSPALTGQEVDDKQIPDRYLFYPAQYWPHKNHIGLLLALRILREKYGLTLELVLTGSDKGNLGYVREKVGELGLSNQVRFLGFVEEDLLKRLYSRAFALVYPTFFGPDNLPPLEAFALGCPVVASRVDGADEQLGSSALLFDPRCPEEMALRVKELHDSPALRREMIERGRARAHSWKSENYVERMFRIVDDFELVRRCWSSSQPYVHP